MTLSAEVMPGWTRCDAQEPNTGEGPGLTQSGYSEDGWMNVRFCNVHTTGIKSQPLGQKVPRGPHSNSHSNYTWGAPGINNCKGQSVDFLLDTGGNFIRAHWSPWSAFLPIHYNTGSVWMSQMLLIQSPFKLQLSLCAVFSWVSNRANISLTPSGEGYIEQGPGLFFHEYGAQSF